MYVRDTHNQDSSLSQRLFCANSILARHVCVCGQGPKSCLSWYKSYLFSLKLHSKIYLVHRHIYLCFLIRTCKIWQNQYHRISYDLLQVDNHLCHERHFDSLFTIHLWHIWRQPAELFTNETSIWALNRKFLTWCHSMIELVSIKSNA